MWKRIGIVLIILTSLISGAITSCQITAPQTSIETYSNTRFGFYVNYPEGWKASEDDYPSGLGTTITFFKEGAAGVAILAWEPSGNPRLNFYSLDDFYDRGVISSWQGCKGFEILEEHDALIEKLPAREVTFTYGTDFVWKATMVAFLDTRHDTAFPDSNAFKITYDMPIDMFDDYYHGFRLIVDTFKFMGE